MAINPDEYSERPVWRKLGIYFPVLLIGGIAAILLVYLSAMRGLGWEIPFIDQNSGGIPFLMGGKQTASDDVYLYVSKSTSSQLARTGGNYELLLNPWRKYFQSRNLSAKEITGSEAINKINRGTLILPSAIALDESERNAIEQFRAKGGAILATWATGSRNASGEWVGWTFLEELCCKVRGEITPEMEVTHLVLNGESPVSFSQSAGLRVWLDKRAEQNLRMVPNQPGARVAARLMNWARIPVQERLDEGGVVYHEASADKGRVVVYAFAESTWESSPDALHILVDDTLNWLGRKPSVVIAAWPNAKRSAQIVAMDTEEGFDNSLSFASMMKAVGYKGTFFLLTSVAKQHPETVKALAQNFEIGLHGDVHNGFKGESSAGQATRMQEMENDLASLLPGNSNALGFRAPTESYDSVTEDLLYKRKYRYHAADPSRTEARLPSYLKSEKVQPQDSMSIIPRTQRDDIFLAKSELGADDWGNAIFNDLSYSIDSGALGYLSIHSQNFYPGHPLTTVMPEYLLRITRNQDVWADSAESIATWWKNRERIKLNARTVGARIDFDITVLGKESIKGIALTVMLPAKDKYPKIQEFKVGMPETKIVRIDDQRAAILFDELNPGSYSYQVLFNR